MPYIRRKLSTAEIANRLAHAEKLKAQGMEIEIPKEWLTPARELHLFEVSVASGPDALVWEADGKVCYEIALCLRAKRSGLLYPDLDIETEWDKGITLESIDDDRAAVKFGQMLYYTENTLNSRFENHIMLPRDGFAEGLVLARGSRSIPAEYPDFHGAKFTVRLLDHSSGELMETVQGQLIVQRSRKHEQQQRPGSLYNRAEDRGRGSPPSRQEEE